MLTPIQQYGHNPKQSVYWYLEEEPHNALKAASNQLQAQKRVREDNNRKLLQFYENAEFYHNSALFTSHQTLSQKLTFNVIRSCVDAAASKIAKNQPKPEFITSDAEWSTQDKAHKLSKFVEGVFYDNNAHDLGQDIFVDACIFGTGVIQVSTINDRIVYERVLIDEILVDDHEGIYRKPRQFIHERAMFRDQLLNRFQDDAKALEAIRKAPRVETQDRSIADRIMVREAWYLPLQDSDSKRVGGKHVIAIDNYTLSNNDYNLDQPPFVFFRWSNSILGFYGKGLAEELVSVQLQIAKLMKLIDRNIKFAGLRVFVEKGSEVNVNHLGNEPATISEYIGTPPQAVTYPAVNQEVYSFLENLYRKAFEITGISQMTAFAEKPSGITAAKALDTLSDTQTERFMLTGKRYERLFMDLAKLTIGIARELYNSEDEEKQRVVLRAKPSDFETSITWSDIDLEESKYELQCFSISAFASSPAARIQQVMEMSKAGILPQKRMMQLLEIIPDFKEFVSLDTASLTRVRKALDSIKKKGEYNAPDEFMDLEEAITVAQAEYNRSINQNVTEHRLQLIRDYISDCQDLLGIAEPQEEAAAMPPDASLSPSLPPALPNDPTGLDPMAGEPPLLPAM
jgi:hypothetical protein